MPAPTTIAPIRVPQINGFYYVGETSFPTIQKAVTAAVADNNGVVIIPWDYAGSDTVAGVTGGANTVCVKDERDLATQIYFWNGTAYVPANFIQLGGGYFGGGIGVSGSASSPAADTVLIETFGGAAYLSACGADPGTNGEMDLRVCASDGSNPVTVLRLKGNGSGLFLSDLLIDGSVTGSAGIAALGEGTPAASILLLDTYGGAGALTGCGPNPATNGEIFLRVCASDGSNAIDVLDVKGNGSAAFIGKLGVGGDLTVAGALMSTALAAPPPPQGCAILEFSASGTNGNGSMNLILNSVNGKGLGGFNLQMYPADGVTPMHTFIRAEAEQDTGIPTIIFPEDVHIVGNVEITGDLQAATCEVGGSPVVTFAHFPPNGPTPYPPAGIGVSTGSAWAVSIDPATLPRLNVANTFTAVNSFAEVIVNGGMNVIGSTPDFLPNSFRSGTAAGVTYLDALGINAANPGTMFLRIANGDGSGFIQAAKFDTSGMELLLGLSVAGTATAGVLHATSIGLGATVGTGKQIGIDALDANTMRLLSLGNTTSAPGAFYMIGYSSDFQIASTYAQCYYDTTRGTMLLCNGSFQVGSGSSFAVDLPTNTIVCWGELICNAGLSVEGGTKNFRIPHPLAKDKWLTHSCVEGPEAAVFYRGEVLVRDEAEVQLPPYFEALTRPDGRTVQLTQLFEDDGNVVIGANTPAMLIASRVKDGRFRIRCSTRAARVYWEVKAVRADVPMLEVVTEREAA
jgi:hypothetical protein